MFIMTLGEILSKIVNNDLDNDHNVIIIDGANVYSGKCSYFIYNGAYDLLRSRNVEYYNSESNVVRLEERM